MTFSRRSNKRIYEPPAILLTDLAFNLVSSSSCASTEGESGRKQPIPRHQGPSAPPQNQNVEVALTRTTVAVNGSVVPIEDLPAKLQPMLTGKTRTEDRMVVLKSNDDAPYSRWIRTTAYIEQAGGIVALQMEEAREVVVP